MSKRFIGASVLMVLLSLSAMAQQTATVIGKVVADNDDPIPGATVVAQSPSRQGSRNAVSNEDGGFVMRFLPPGEHTITVTMPGMDTLKQRLVLNVGSTARPTFVLRVQSQTESLVVTADSNPILDTAQVTSNLKEEFITNLPRRRTVENLVTLTPGVVTGGPSGQPVISGAMSFENNYLLNGGVINSDNLRGRPATLYIEDAIEETTVISGSVSAEYGQFTGGVVNTITKQGGNEFSGSARVSFENEDWEARTPLELQEGTEKDDDISNFQTVTLGGPIIKDRLWFFIAGRREREKGTAQISRGLPLSDSIVDEFSGVWAERGISGAGTPPGVRNIPADQDEDRYEIKLTFTPVENHSFVASYLDVDFAETNDTQFGVISQSAVVAARELPESLATFNYRGILTPSFSIEAFYSERKLTFLQQLNGGTDRISGTTIEDWNTQNTLNYGAPFFGAKPEKRDNEMYWVKGSYFLNTSSMGTHDIVFGYNNFTDTRKADNEQAPSGFRSFPSATRFDANGNPIPIWVNVEQSPNALVGAISYWPILNPSVGSNLEVESYYVNDVWQLNEKWRFNIGFRYDSNNATGQDNALISDDDKISPRLSATYDIFGDGRHVVEAGYSEYVSRLSDAADGATSAGSPALYYWVYRGDYTESLEDVFAWLETTYGSDFLSIDNAIQNADAVNIPGQTTVIRETLVSPSSEEIMLGYNTRLGSRGYFKVNYIHREFEDFYVGLTNTDIGQNDTGSDLEILANDPGLYEREYDGIQLQGSYQISDAIGFGGNWTWSQLSGNIDGETAGSGSISSSSLSTYPEYNSFDNRAPIGNLSADIRNTGNIWLTYDLSTGFGDINFSLLQTYRSGEHYSAVSSNVPTTEAYGFPVNPGYSNPPTSASYFFSGRGEFTTEDLYSTDLGVNYTINWKRLEFFVEMELLNLFNNDEVTDAANIDTSVNLTGQAWNVFNEAAVEGVHYNLSDSFGEATNRTAYQLPRTFRFDVGIRF